MAADVLSPAGHQQWRLGKMGPCLPLERNSSTCAIWAWKNDTKYEWSFIFFYNYSSLEKDKSDVSQWWISSLIPTGFWCSGGVNLCQIRSVDDVWCWDNMILMSSGWCSVVWCCCNAAWDNMILHKVLQRLNEKIYILTPRRHLISRPHGQAMGCLLWWFCRKYTTL